MIQYPIFDLEDNESDAVGIQDKVGFFAMDVREIPGKVCIVRLGGRRKKR
jgi:hypothetical protein